MEDGDRLAPIALPREQPVPEAIGGLRCAGADLRQEGDHGTLCLGHRHAIQEAGVDQRSVPLPSHVPHVRSNHDTDDREIECPGKSAVPCVMGRDSHDRASTVTAQHVVRDPDGQVRAVGWVDDMGASEDSGFRPSGVRTCGLPKTLNHPHIAVHGRPLP
jgi:hypothetical protein